MWDRDIAEGIRALETNLPRDVEDGLRRSATLEEGNSRKVLEAVLENIGYSREHGIPMCQDTGTLVFFVWCDRCVKEVYDAIASGIEIATREVPLRPNTVNPFTRANVGGNLGKGCPIIHLEPGLGNGKVTMAIMAKGAGSENVSRSLMLDPDQGVEGIREAVLDAVRGAGAKPCPPIIVGLGVGGSLEWSGYLAKKALLRPLDEPTADPFASDLEERLLGEINGLGIGPMGFGGKTTALGVRAEWAHCHTASLPVSINIQCWALRRILLEWQDGRFILR